MIDMTKIYQCQIPNCGYTYDPEKGDKKSGCPAGTEFINLPDTWKCPFCSASKKSFRPLVEKNTGN